MLLLVHTWYRPGVRRGVPRSAGLGGIGLGPILVVLDLMTLARTSYHPFRCYRRAGRRCRRLRGAALAAVTTAATTGAAGAVTTTDSVANGAVGPGKEGGKIKSRHSVIIGGSLFDSCRLLSVPDPHGVGDTASGGG